MFLIGKIIHYLVLPPGIIIITGLITALLIVKKRQAAALTLLGTGTLALLLFSMAPTSNMLLLPLENAFPVFNGAAGGATHIVVLGGGTVHNSPDEAGGGSVHTGAMKRLLYAFRIYQKTRLPLVLSGGRVFDPGDVESEAAIARRILMELGVPARKIITEEKSRNTWENARFIKKSIGSKKVILVTSAYHMRRSIYCFAGNGITAVPAPTDFKARRIPHSIKTLLPSMRYFNNSYYAIREYIGLLYYRLRY